jgi:hypothetical protein
MQLLEEGVLHGKGHVQDDGCLSGRVSSFCSCCFSSVSLGYHVTFKGINTMSFSQHEKLVLDTFEATWNDFYSLKPAANLPLKGRASLHNQPPVDIGRTQPLTNRASDKATRSVDVTYSVAPGTSAKKMVAKDTSSRSLPASTSTEPPFTGCTPAKETISVEEETLLLFLPELDREAEEIYWGLGFGMRNAQDDQDPECKCGAEKH